MGKVLSWVVLAAVGWVVWKFVVISQRKEAAREAAGPATGGPPAPSPGGELMVRCDHCGIHVPLSEAVTAGDQRYCSRAHRDAGPRSLGSPGAH